jgi:hypothetical protein
MITIEGLSKKQRALADILWAMDGTEQVHAFIAALHPKDRIDAKTVCEMMILACIDECEDTQDAQRVIQSIVDGL